MVDDGSIGADDGQIHSIADDTFAETVALGAVFIPQEQVCSWQVLSKTGKGRLLR